MPPGSERRLEEELDELKQQFTQQQKILEEQREANDPDSDNNMVMEAMEALQEYNAQNAEMVKKFLTMEARVSEAQGVVKVCTDNASKMADVETKMEESSKVAAGAAKMAIKVKEQVDASQSRLQSELKAGLQGLAEELRGELEAVASRLRAEAESAVDAVRRQTQELVLQQKEAVLAEADARSREDAAALQEELREAQESLRAELARAELAAEERASSLTSALDSRVAHVLQSLEDVGDRQRELAHTQFRTLSSDVQERLSAAQAESHRRMMQLQETCAAAAGSLTQQVEWRIEDCLKQLGPVEPEGAARQWLSPPFEAAGVGGLRLELRARSRRGGSDEGDAAALECSAFLHAPAGLRLEFRLFIGDESLSLVHSFDDSGRCGAEHAGVLSEHVSRQDGSLRLGVEILTAAREVITSSPERERPAGVIVSRQCINNRLLEAIDTRTKDMMESVSRRLDVSRSRAVRRVQWRVEQGSVLLQRFAQGKAVCSAPFQACGIDGLQMVFYPRGCEGAKEGFCSFFLVCPPGVTIRCWLWAGRWRREARMEPAGKQDLLGRANFCRFQNCVDPTSENVELALEIQEAEQSTLEGQQEIDSTFDAEALTPLQPRQAADISRVDVSTQKVQHAPGKVLPDQVMQLPSVWTSHGFRSFEDIGSDSLRAATAQSESWGSCGRPVPAVAPGPPARSGAQGQPRASSSLGGHKGTPREPRRQAQTARGASLRTQSRGVPRLVADNGKYTVYDGHA